MTENIKKLIAKYFSDELSRNEANELVTWIETGKNLDIFNRYVELNFTIENINSTKNDHSMLWKYIEADLDKPSRKSLNYWKYAVAASIILLISITFFLNKKNNLTETTPTIVKTDIIAPGTDKATLTLEDGTNVTLEKGQDYIANNLKSNGEEIVYNSSSVTKPEIAFNYLTIPRGGQFHLRLSDETEVWLNSETQLKYPVNFIEGETRQVELVYGEAYFDVSPSIEHKGSRFKVFNQSQEIEVLGTEFNIKAYKGESNIFTTLVEGKVIINYSNKKQILKPNQQANLNIKSKTAHIVSVDVYNEISWKEGIFSFRRKSLSEIMKVLSRWYDTEFVIENSNIDKAGFNGIIGKDQKIEDILNTIKSFGVIKDYQIIDKIVIIK
jgi:transmembrane sensor